MAIVSYHNGNQSSYSNKLHKPKRLDYVVEVKGKVLHQILKCGANQVHLWSCDKGHRIVDHSELQRKFKTLRG